MTQPDMLPSIDCLAGVWHRAATRTAGFMGARWLTGAARRPPPRPASGRFLLSVSCTPVATTIATSLALDTAKPALASRFHAQFLEATTGFEPVHSGFADRPLNHLGTSPLKLAGPPGFEPGLTDPKSAVLPLDEGPALHAAV